MAQQIQTSLMVGGLDLVTPPIALPPGKAISALNYEPDVSGYTSMAGFERFDGNPRPSDSTDPTTIAARREAISAVPGEGPVRGVWVFDGDIYAFRDQIGIGYAGMYRAGLGGWEQIAFGWILPFAAGGTEFLPGEYVVDGTTGALAWVERVVLRAGAWDGTAEGHLIVSQLSGTFGNNTITSTSGGHATGGATLAIQPLSGGHYDFANHNFYGATTRAHMYFASGTDTAYEFSGAVLAPINTGITSGAEVAVSQLLAPVAPISDGLPLFLENSTGTTSDDDNIILSASFDAPSFITHYKNHLFLGYSSGTVLNSSLGEPLEYMTTTGAGEIAFGEQITGLLTGASTALVIFAQNRIEYVTGQDVTTFTMQGISDSSGAKPYTAQMMDTPMFLDDGGVRNMPTTAAFGDWRMGTVTQQIETLIKQKRDGGVQPVASMVIKGKDQFRLFWDDNTGLTIYIGRKNPESMPFRLPIQVFCACNGEVDTGHGDRLFVGCEDGFVYEMNRGTSFDGAPIDSYIRLPFNAAGSPNQVTRWMKVTFELSSPDDLTFGVAYDVDYAKGNPGAKTDVNVEAGSAIVNTDPYADVNWTQAVEGRLEYHLTGIGPNIATTLVHSSTTARQHTISSQTYNFSRRRLKR